MAEESPINAGADTATDIDQSKIPAPQVFDDGSSLSIDSAGNVTATESTDRLRSSGLIEGAVAVGASLVNGITGGIRGISGFFSGSSGAGGLLGGLLGGGGGAGGGGAGGGGARVEWNGAPDMRASITVPSNYLIGPCSMLSDLGGILFPYTPNISYDNQANYSTQNPMHSNWPVNFYQRSTISQINISGKFTNQNENDGAYYLATIHLLRALTKMLWATDAHAGSPPPVCRLNAYGDSMLSNVPVSVASFKVELPDGVDYITVGQSSAYQSLFGISMVPTVSTINISLHLMLSRQEMQDYSVTDWLNGSLRGRGYL